MSTEKIVHVRHWFYSSQQCINHWFHSSLQCIKFKKAIMSPIVVTNASLPSNDQILSLQASMRLDQWQPHHDQVQLSHWDLPLLTLTCLVSMRGWVISHILHIICIHYILYAYIVKTGYFSLSNLSLSFLRLYFFTLSHLQQYRKN